MLLIQVGHLRINLEYLICDQEGDGTPATAGLPPGDIRITLERGKEFVLCGEDAESYRRQVEPYVLRDPADGDSAGSSSDRGPVSGHLAPRPVPPEPEHGHGVDPQAGGGHRPERGERRRDEALDPDQAETQGADPADRLGA